MQILQPPGWARAKGFDTFCPLGPAIETELDPLEKLAVICRVNGEVRQAGFTSDMVFGVAELMEFVTAVMTLLPGDVILTSDPFKCSASISHTNDWLVLVRQ